MRAATTSAFVFNVCTGKGKSVLSLAQTMAALCRTELVVHRRTARCGEVRMSIGDPRRTAAQLGFTARTTLTDGLAITLERLKLNSEVEAQVVA
jgi:UDP-glucose 4-epimerase